MPVSTKPIHSSPNMQTKKPGVDKKGYQHPQLATNNAVYHPTKGWRTMRRYPEHGHYKIQEFLRRLFAVNS